LNKYKRYIPIAAALLLAFGVSLDQFGIDLRAISQGGGVFSSSSDQPINSTANQSSSAAQHSSAKWSSTEPNINLWHVFEGEINRKGKPVGYHSRPGGQDPAGARIKALRDEPNRAGVYTATIEIRDGDQWKQKFSSFFPDSMSQNEVINAVLNAYHNSSNQQAQPFEGPSGHGFSIQGYTSSQGGINTAFPVYVRSQ